MVPLFFSPILILAVDAFLTDVPRNVVKELRVTNGGPWGDWTGAQFCADGAFAVGYSMQIEPALHDGDDTSLNSIALHCQFVETVLFGGDITSGKGIWGSWGNKTLCMSDSDPSRTRRYLKSFALQVEGDQHRGDDTAANYVKFTCRDLMDETTSDVLSAPPGHGLYGSLGAWSDTCDPGSAICGMKTRVERDQHGGDDTTLNDVVFFCCTP